MRKRINKFNKIKQIKQIKQKQNNDKEKTMLDIASFLTFLISFYIWINLASSSTTPLELASIPFSIYYVIFFTTLVLFIISIIESSFFINSQSTFKNIWEIALALFMAASASQILTETYIHTQKKTATLSVAKTTQFVSFYIVLFTLLNVFASRRYNHIKR